MNDQSKPTREQIREQQELVSYIDQKLKTIFGEEMAFALLATDMQGIKPSRYIGNVPSSEAVPSIFKPFIEIHRKGDCKIDAIKVIKSSKIN